MKTLITILLGLTLVIAFASVSHAHIERIPTVEPVETTDSAAAAADKATPSDQLVVYYLHSNRRCATCKKLEAYSAEAIEVGFAKQLTDSSIVWRVVNFEEEENQHFAKEYELFSQSVVLSKLQDGKQTEWKSLQKIWELVGDKEEFIAYVQTEVKQFLKPTKEK